MVGYDKDHKDNNVFDGQWQPVDIPNYAQDALTGTEPMPISPLMAALNSGKAVAMGT